MKLSEISVLVRGRCYGKKGLAIERILPPEEAGRSDLAFLFDPRIRTRARAVISTREITGKSGIVVPEPRQALYRLLKHLSSKKNASSISESALIDPSADIARGCTVEPYAVVGKDVRVGAGAFLGAHCYIGEKCVIGRHCTIQAGAVITGAARIGDHVVIGANSVIGKEGFGYLRSSARASAYRRIGHIGSVRIGSYVDIGGNVTIDRGTIGATSVGRGTKIDNLVHIAHNVKIGKNCLIMGQCGIAGSSVIGDNAVLCGQVGVSDHVTIGREAVVLAKSAVFKSVPGSRRYSGIPAREHQAVLRALARLYGRNTQ